MQLQVTKRAVKGALQEANWSWGDTPGGFIAHAFDGDTTGDIVEIWLWVNTYRYIGSGMNIHLPAILGFTRYQGFDPSPYDEDMMVE